MLLKYDLHEAARYMGYKHGAEPSEEICELCEVAYNELCKVITPKYIYKEYDFTRTDNGIIVDGIEFKSEKLFKVMIKYIAPVFIVLILVSSVLDALGIFKI